MFDHAKNFKITADGIELPFDEKLIDTNLEFNSKNMLATGDYYATYKFVINGVEFKRTINYKIYAHDVTASDSKVTYKASQLTAENLNIFDIFYVKVNGSSATYSGLDIAFVDVTKKDEYTPVEGKTPVYYTVNSEIAYGTPGTYKVGFSFSLDGLVYEFTTDVTIENDVAITEASSKDVLVYVGTESYDFTKMFTIKEYDAESNSNNTVEVTADMIDSAQVDFTKAGEYDITCKYKDVSYTKKIIVKAAKFIGTWNGIGSEANLTSITLNADGSATAVIAGGDKIGSYYEDNGVYKVTFESTAGMFNASYVEDGDILYVTWNYSGSNLSLKNSNIFVRNAEDYDTLQVASFINNATAFSSSNSVKLYAYKLTNKTTNKTTNAIMQVKYKEAYSYYDDDSYTASWYINPTIEGTWFEGTSKVTLDTNTYDITFTTADDATTMSFVKGTASSSGETTPSTPSTDENLDGFAGTYTGEFSLTLDGKGKATLENSSLEANYGGFKYQIKGNDCILTWTDKSYDSQIKVFVLNTTDHTFTEKASDDFKNTYAYGTSIKIVFLGNGYANANYFSYSSEVCSYEKTDKTIVLSNGENTATFTLTNGDNTLALTSYEGKLYSENATALTCDKILNHRLTVNNSIRVALNGQLNVADVFSVEYMDNDGTIKTEVIDSTNTDMSAVDTSVSGYYIVTFKAKYGDVLYEASGLVYVYPIPYANAPETGHWTGKTSSSYSGMYTYELDLTADGSGTYTKTEYSTTSYPTEWVLNDNKVSWTYTPYSSPTTSELTYNDGYMFGIVTGSSYIYLFKDLDVTSTYSSYINGKTHILTIAEDAHGIEKYFYSIDGTAYGEVAVKFNTTNIEDGTIFTVSKDKEAIVEGQISSKSFNLAGVEKGDYTLDGSSKLTFDGFGNATYGDKKGTYEKVKTYYRVTFTDGSSKLFTINSDNTYVEEDESAILRGTTKEYAIEVTEGVDCANIAYEKEVWFKFTAAKSATYKIYSTNNSSVDNKAYIYDEADAQVAYNDDGSDKVVALLVDTNSISTLNKH